MNNTPDTKNKVIKIYRIERGMLEYQLTDISPPHEDNFHLDLDDLLNQFKEKIISFKGELSDKRECQLKGARYMIRVKYLDYRGTDYEIMWDLRYLKLVDIDTRDALKKILHQLRSSNPKGVGKFISCLNPPEEEPGQIFKDGFTKYSCLEKFNDLNEGFQLALFVEGELKERFYDALLVEEVIMLLLREDELEEINFKLVEGELVQNHLKLSTILPAHINFANLFAKYYATNRFKESNWSSTINYKNPSDLYLTSSRVNFKVFDKEPPA